MASNRSSQPTSNGVATIPDDTKPPEYAAETDTPFTVKCQHCGQKVVTDITYKAGSFTWIACILMASFGFFLGCCLIPFCIKSAKDTVHMCGTCDKEIGRRSKFWLNDHRNYGGLLTWLTTDCLLVFYFWFWIDWRSVSIPMFTDIYRYGLVKVVATHTMLGRLPISLLGLVFFSFPLVPLTIKH